MASKQHCDFCDSTNGVRSSGAESIVLTVNNRRRPLQLAISFRKEYGSHDPDDNDASDRIDMCHDCQREVFERLFVKFGGSILVKG